MGVKEFNELFLAVAIKYAEYVKGNLAGMKTGEIPLEKSENLEMQVRLVNTLAVTVDRINSPNSVYFPQA